MDGDKDAKIEVMIKRIPLIIFSFLICIQLSCNASTKEALVKFKSNLPNKKTVTVFLEVAITDEEKAKGLMNRPNLALNRGMVFVFKPRRKVTFWMKDTLIPLDMVFINNGKIVKIIKDAMPNQTQTLYPSDFEVTDVVEVNGGFTDKYMVNVGSSVVFRNVPLQ